MGYSKKRVLTGTPDDYDFCRVFIVKAAKEWDKEKQGLLSTRALYTELEKEYDLQAQMANLSLNTIRQWCVKEGITLATAAEQNRARAKRKKKVSKEVEKAAIEDDIKKFEKKSNDLIKKLKSGELSVDDLVRENASKLQVVIEELIEAAAIENTVTAREKVARAIIASISVFKEARIIENKCTNSMQLSPNVKAMLDNVLAIEENKNNRIKKYLDEEN